MPKLITVHKDTKAAQKLAKKHNISMNKSVKLIKLNKFLEEYKK